MGIFLFVFIYLVEPDYFRVLFAALRELVLHAVRCDDIGVLKQLYRAAPPLLDILLAQRRALGLLRLGQLALLREPRKLIYTVKFCLFH